MEQIAPPQPDIYNKHEPIAPSLPRRYRVWDTQPILEPLGILALHASAVRVNGEALIFLGPSGTGKSTICELLSPDAEPLADDKVYIVPRGKRRWVIADAGERILEGPLTQREAAAIEGPPLRAIFRLYQASRPRLTPIDAVETCRHLTNAFFELYWLQRLDMESKRLAYARLAAIAQSTPGYRLQFDLSHRALAVTLKMLPLQRLPKQVD
jgi:hypothetical protein